MLSVKRKKLRNLPPVPSARRRWVPFIFMASALAAQPFPREEVGPGTAGFRDRLLGLYGVNSEIEPSLGREEKEVYEAVAPFLENNPRRAIREVEEALDQSGEDNAAFRFLLGTLYYQTGRSGAAERHLRRAIREFPDFRRAHRVLGLLHVQAERFEEAADAMRRVIELGGGDAQSYGLLAYAHLTRKKYQSALSAYRMARMFRPDSRDFRRGEAQALLETKRFREAIALFDELLAEDPGTADFWRLQANAYLETGRESEAIANLEILESFNQATSQSGFLLGDLYLNNDNHRLAREQYETTLRAMDEINAERIERVLRPLRLFLSRGLYEAAGSYLGVLESRLPDSLGKEHASTLQLARARIARREGRSDAARESLRELVEAQPLNGEALLFLGRLLREEEAYGEAEFYLERALSVEDRQTEARIELARLEVARDDLETALEYLHTVKETDPDRSGLDRYIRSIESALED